MNDKYNEIKEKILVGKEKYNNSIDLIRPDNIIIGNPIKELPTDKLVYPEEIIYFYAQKGDLTFDILNQLHKEKLCSIYTIFFGIINRSKTDNIYNIELTHEQLLEKAMKGNEFAQELLVFHSYVEPNDPFEGVQKIEEYAENGWKFAIITLLHIYKKGGMPRLYPNPIKLKETCIKYGIPFDEETKDYDISVLKKKYNK